uniref:Uncharacterized protein n=1 Tax=Picea glauca TaxID=3330 RepID=A0A101LWL4_PICGL|nr:hypothetical protein ABT39_MTgene1599 [Picea glauca]QHR89155.1 hypothetical protein Q903MT_gene3175 [Picea sitchensis]
MQELQGWSRQVGRKGSLSLGYLYYCKTTTSNGRASLFYSVFTLLIIKVKAPNLGATQYIVLHIVVSCCWDV